MVEGDKQKKPSLIDDDDDDDDAKDEDQVFAEPTVGFQALMARWSAESEAADKVTPIPSTFSTALPDGPRTGRRLGGSMIATRKTSFKGVVKDTSLDSSSMHTMRKSMNLPRARPSGSLVASRRASLENTQGATDKAKPQVNLPVGSKSLVANRRASLETSTQGVSTTSVTAATSATTTTTADKLRFSNAHISLPSGVVANRRASLEHTIKEATTTVQPPLKLTPPESTAQPAPVPTTITEEPPPPQLQPAIPEATPQPQPEIPTATPQPQPQPQPEIPTATPQPQPEPTKTPQPQPAIPTTTPPPTKDTSSTKPEQPGEVPQQPSLPTRVVSGPAELQHRQAPGGASAATPLPPTFEEQGGGDDARKSGNELLDDMDDDDIPMPTAPIVRSESAPMALRGKRTVTDRSKTRQDLKDEFMAKDGPKNKKAFRMPGNLYEAAPKFKKGFKPPKFPKSDDEVAVVRKALKKNFVFSNLTRKQMKPLIDAFEPCTFNAKQVIIKQGDGGDYFYIVEKGKVKFKVDGVEVGKAGKGSSFGELALLYTCPRAATVVAAKETKVFRVDQKTFQFILQNQTKESEKEKLELLKRVNFLKDLDIADLKHLAEVMTPRIFAAGDMIVKKGDIGDAFYVIQEGSVEVTDISVGTTTYEDITLGPGDHFGERALVTLEPRAANVIGKTRGVAFSIDQERFNTVLGSMSSLILKAQDVRVLSGVTLLQKANLSHEDISDLADLLTESFFMKHQKIMEEGKKVIPSLYYIREGEATIISKKGGTRTITQGGYFGQELMVLACENNTPRVVSPYTVTCSVYSTVAVLSLADCRYIFDVSLLIKDDNEEEGLPVDEKPKVEIDLDTIEKKTILGAGTFGQVWLISAKDKSGNSGAYAMKIQSKYDIAFDHQVQAVIREKKILLEVHHPFLLNLITAYQDKNFLYFLAEFIQGGELFTVIHSDEGSGLEEAEAKFYGLAIADALSYLHRSKIVYRDLKPENVLIDGLGYPKIVDFGFAKRVEDKTFTFCGTPGYIPPEIITKRGHNMSADHWSLGILIFEMLAGENPFYFEGMDQITLFRSICEDEYLPLSGVSEEAAALVAQLLVKDPSQRLGSVKQGEKRVLENVWFKELDLPAMRRRELPAPWVPLCSDALDARNFESWDDMIDKSTETYPPLELADAKRFNEEF